MDSELEERKLSSIRRPQILFIYRKGGVGNPETFGQIACSVWRLPIRFTVGTGGTIGMQARAGMMMKPSLASNALRRTALKILGEGGHVEVAVCVGENGDVFVGHGFILPVTIALCGGCKSG